MDCSPCLYCLRNKRTSEFHDWTVGEGCTEYFQISHSCTIPCVSCDRNFKRRPWRRKSLLKSVPKWSWPKSVPWTALLLLLINIFQGLFKVLSRTIFMNKNSRLTPLWGLLFIALFGGTSLPLASCQESLQPAPSVTSLQLPNAMVFVGSAFAYNISESVFGCAVDSIVVCICSIRLLCRYSYATDLPVMSCVAVAS